MSPPQVRAANGAANAGSLQALTLCWMRGTHDPVPGRGVAGVYVIWRTDRFGRECLVVGEARDIATDLARTFRESHIAGYAATGALEVSWAAVASIHRPGIAGFLATALAPVLVGSAGVARHVAVNLPH